MRIGFIGINLKPGKFLNIKSGWILCSRDGWTSKYMIKPLLTMKTNDDYHYLIDDRFQEDDDVKEYFRNLFFSKEN